MLAASVVRVQGEGMNSESGQGAIENGDNYEGWAPDPELVAERELGSDVWFAGMLAEQHGANIKYVWEWHKWFVWDEDAGLWRHDEAAPWIAAKATVKKLLETISEVDTDTAKARLKGARRFLNRGAMESAISLAKSDARVSVAFDVWDRDPFLLHCANGTVDLHDGTPRKHARSDHLTKAAGGAFGNECPLWRKFLERILPDSGVREYLQRAIGYAAIGEVREHLLHILWGCGANGKSVFVNTITAALGDYAITLPPGLMLASNTQEHPTLRASLFGARFAVASETNENGSFDCAAMKVLTGGDLLSARRMREDYWTFKPSHTLFLATNHRPRASDSSTGFWRRIRLIPFTVTIPPEEQDADLSRKLLEELPGIIGWIVEGASRYMESGLIPPPTVAAATDDYKREEDTFGDFLDTNGISPSSDGFVASSYILELYEDWAKKMGHKPLSSKTISNKLKDRGFVSDRSDKARGFKATRIIKMTDG